MCTLESALIEQNIALAEWHRLRSDFDPLRQSLTKSLIFPDFDLNPLVDRIGPKDVSARGAIACIPHSYFKDLVKPERSADFLAYCIGNGFINWRSKLIQARLTPHLDTKHHLPPCALDITTSDQSLSFFVHLGNEHTSKTLKLPKYRFPAGKIVIPTSAPIRGKSLYDEACALQTADVGAFTTSGLHVHPDQAFRRSAVIDEYEGLTLPIRRYAKPDTTRRIVDLDNILQIPSKRRDLLDQALGYSWGTAYSEENWQNRLVIAETDPIVLSSDRILIIDDSPTSDGQSVYNHQPSLVISPGFKNTIRLEYRYYGPVTLVPRYVRARLYPA
jgi:hypothetical protein